MVKKIKIVNLNWNLICRLIWICRFNGWVHFFWFRLEIPFLGKFGPENQNCQFKLKFGAKTNLNMQNLVVRVIHFFCFWLGIPFWEKFYLEAEVWYLEISNKQNSCYSRFSNFDEIYSFLGKFGPENQNCQFKLKFGMQTDLNMQSSMVVFIFSDLDWKHPFWVNLVQKVNIASLSWNLLTGLIQICWSHQWCSLFQLSMGNTLLDKFAQKIKLSV